VLNLKHYFSLISSSLIIIKKRNDYGTRYTTDLKIALKDIRRMDKKEEALYPDGKFASPIPMEKSQISASKIGKSQFPIYPFRTLLSRMLDIELEHWYRAIVVQGLFITCIMNGWNLSYFSFRRKGSCASTQIIEVSMWW